MRLSQPRARSGFTLIELLVVITIMVILMTMGMGAYSKAKSAVRKVESLNNLRSMGTAMYVISSGNGGHLPSEAGDTKQSIFTTILGEMDEGKAANAADPTLVSIRAFIDPARRSVSSAVGRRDYGYATSGGNSPLEIPGGIDSSNVPNGAQYTAVMSVLYMDPTQYLKPGGPGDGYWSQMNNSRSIGQAFKDGTPGCPAEKAMGSPHSGGIPVLFVDGHTSNVSYTMNKAYWDYMWNSSNTTSFNFPN